MELGFDKYFKIKSTLEKKVEKELIKVKCPHNEYCNIKTLKGIETCYMENAINCKTHKFYDTKCLTS